MKNDLSSMRHWDSNSQPLEHESPSLTTRPGLFKLRDSSWKTLLLSDLSLETLDIENSMIQRTNISFCGKGSACLAVQL